MQAGLLQESIIVERPHVHKDSYGSETVVYRHHIATRARIDWKGGGRNVENDEIVFNRNLTFIVRYYHDIQDLDRIIWKGRKYRILFVEEHKREQRKIITAELINE